MRTLSLTLAYDGTDFVGWQVQPTGRSVQATVERALQRLTGETIRVRAAGRTDSGVHALGQVISFATAATIPTDRFPQALQTHLPDDITVIAARDVPDDFHATYSAVSKHYRYIIYNGRRRLPFLRNYTHHHRGPLDVSAMQEAAGAFPGTHDFRSFETQWPNKATSVRTVLQCSVRRVAGWSVWSRELADLPSGTPAATPAATPADFICLDITADGFLYNMVRAIAGTLLKVGQGRWNRGDVEQIIAARDRNHAGETAPACGLYLVAVRYPPGRC